MPRRISPGHLLHVARGRYAARVLTADSPHPFLKTRPAAQAGRRSATDFAAPGCAMAHLPDAGGQVARNDGGSSDRPSTMPRAVHAAIHQASANARGAFILGDSELTLPAMGCVPATLLCRDAGAMLPFGEDHTQRRPWLVVNPG